MIDVIDIISASLHVMFSEKARKTLRLMNSNDSN